MLIFSLNWRGEEQTGLLLEWEAAKEEMRGEKERCTVIQRLPFKRQWPGKKAIFFSLRFLNKQPADADNRVQRVQECQRGKNGRENGMGGRWEVGQFQQEPLCAPF